MAASISAVAAIWPSAPTAVQASEARFGAGSGPANHATTGEREQAEGQAEKEADVGRADRAEHAGEAALGGVAEGLGGGGDEGEHHPQPGSDCHREMPFARIGAAAV